MSKEGGKGGRKGERPKEAIGGVGRSMDRGGEQKDG